MEFKKIDLLMEDKSEEGIIKKALSKLKNVRNRAQSEIKETKALVRILTHAIKSYAKSREFDLNEEDKKFIKGQSVDVVRGLILTIVSMIPLPIPLTPFLIIFGKKIGIDLVPKEQQIPNKGKSKKDRIDENKFMKFVTILNEQIENEEKNNLIYQLCDQATKKKLKSSPFCKLKEYYEKSGKKEEILKAIEIIYNFLIIDKSKVNQGVFSRIVRASIISNESVEQVLGVISYFIITEKQKIEDDKTTPTDDKELLKQKLYNELKSFRGKTFVPANSEEFLRMIRHVSHSEYEKSLTQDEFDEHKTSLQLDYKCSDDINKTLLKLFEIIKTESPENKYNKFNEIFFKVTTCLESFMKGSKEVIKADAKYKLDKPLMYDGNPVIYPGDYVEIKKMDPEVDSYLSEFFGVFKEGKNKSKKRDYMILYNFFIDMLFEWVLINGDSYKQKVLDGMSGIIYDNHIFVPKEQIDVYWSNLGQRGCEERRLSLRFRLKSGLKTMVGYIYEPGRGEKSLTRTEVRNLPSEFKERLVCRELHFDLLNFGKDYISKQDYEKQNLKEDKRINIVLTEAQYRQLTEENLREFLYSFWNKQKKEGEDPSLDDIIFQVTDIREHSRDDYNIIRPLWYRYNGGYNKLLDKIKREFLDKEFYLEGGVNLKMNFRIDDIESYGIDVYGGMIDINCQILDGTVDGYVLNPETDQMEEVLNMTIQDQFSELEYDTGDFEDFLKKEILNFLENKFEKYGVPIHIESLV